MVIGTYSCHCHEFKTFEEAKKARSKKFELGQKVANRCTNQRKEIGFIHRILEEKGYYMVKFGKYQSDIELKHAEEIVSVQD